MTSVTERYGENFFEGKSDTTQYSASFYSVRGYSEEHPAK